MEEKKITKENALSTHNMLKKIVSLRNIAEKNSAAKQCEEIILSILENEPWHDLAEDIDLILQIVNTKFKNKKEIINIHHVLRPEEFNKVHMYSQNNLRLMDFDEYIEELWIIAKDVRNCAILLPVLELYNGKNYKKEISLALKIYDNPQLYLTGHEYISWMKSIVLANKKPLTNTCLTQITEYKILLDFYDELRIPNEILHKMREYYLMFYSSRASNEDLMNLLPKVDGHNSRCFEFALHYPKYATMPLKSIKDGNNINVICSQLKGYSELKFNAKDYSDHFILLKVLMNEDNVNSIKRLIDLGWFQCVSPLQFEKLSENKPEIVRKILEWLKKDETRLYRPLWKKLSPNRKKKDNLYY
jgi:hypothetical protein